MMMGLGLELTIKDFLRLSRYPKVIFITLFAQLVLLPSVAFFICLILDLPALLAVGPDVASRLTWWPQPQTCLATYIKVMWH